MKLCTCSVEDLKTGQRESKEHETCKVAFCGHLIYDTFLQDEGAALPLSEALTPWIGVVNLQIPSNGFTPKNLAQA